jgi:hypothetical protein
MPAFSSAHAIIGATLGKPKVWNTMLRAYPVAFVGRIPIAARKLKHFYAAIRA